MYTKQSKKMIVLDILDILRRYTDENHSLSQKEIEELLKNEYDLVVDRKSIKRNIMDLIDMGMDIQWSEKTRLVYCRDTGEMEEQAVCSGFYLQKEIMDCELHFLIDSVLDAECIPDNQKDELIRKLEGLSSKYFRKRSGFVKKEMNSRFTNSQLFYTLDIINESIARNRKVSFRYPLYRVGGEGLEEEFTECTVTPYETELRDGRYYLFCRDEREEELMYRLDLISNMRMAETSGNRYGKKTRKESGARELSVKFLSAEDRVSEFVECFGSRDLRVNRMRNGHILVSTKTDVQRAVDFAMNHTMDTTILEPESLRNHVFRMLQSGLEGYSEGPNGLVS